MNRLFPILFVSTLLLSCSDKPFRKEKIFAGGKVVSAQKLNLGKTTYEEYCFACHGLNGNGQGVASKGLFPPPRNLQLGLYKFGNVPAGELPQDEDFKRIIKQGLHGTAMLAWDIEDDERLDALVQYIKTFAPKVWEGEDKKVGKPVELIKDPYGMAHKNSAIEKGKFVYHMTAQCQACHRGYASQSELNAWNQKLYGEPHSPIDAEFYYNVKLQEGEYQAKNLPPDFTWHSVRSAVTVKEIAYRLAHGISGTAMPAWKDTLTDDEIWAVAHYVRYLMDLKDNEKARNEYMGRLKR